MTPRGLKRVLVGETSLERKCRWWFGIALGVLLVLSFYWSGQQLRDFLRQSDRKLGRELVRAANIERHFEELMQPSAEEEAGLRPEEVDTWKEIIANLVQASQASGVKYQSYSVKPQDAGNPNAYGRPEHPHEWELLRRYLDAEPDTKEAEPASRYDDDGTIWRFYQPLYAEKTCVTCHSIWGKPVRAGIVEGDLIAVMRIEVDRKSGRSDIAAYDATMWGVAVVIFFLSMFLLWFIVKLLIVKPVTHLREVANAVREGDTSQRADIQTGDEFEELAASFNRMLRQLLSQQNSLEGINNELDSKVDELAQMNLRLFEMNRLKSDFLATMSHELRTPLNSILGFSEVLATVDTLDPKQQRYVGNIQRSGKMLLEMINDILDLAKLESGRMDASPVELPLAAIVTAQCDMARPLAERKNIDLEAECEAGVPPLRQDQAKLQQILNNLLSNAIKFTPEGGRILVRARREEDHAHGSPHRLSSVATLVLEVEDTGIGISDADQAIIFEKFRQGASAVPGGDAMTREQGGTGLGLSIVRELCRLLGGDVTVRSVSGKGSTFTVRLPWRLPDRSDLEAEMNRGVAELTRPATQALPSPAAVSSH
ncbi:Autoinducer 2 sensor kinase/phosphatase LuxQ [Botrimarina colliarenosi]|uniref:histidine kinase n=1 Tax=Botrimarina colliarenosi TaxID=2528001 RepID=A0A5C6AKU8_9BACT|nr:ATP-binding protein [Botrimarina colliarenosi]TWT99805.1 Autoinducer 2 sensor kinase/phosphatase LuxQ [Botrimarina colliarenosi]